MVRQFKYHEQKLLKKVDFLNVSASDTATRAAVAEGRRGSGSRTRTFGRSRSCAGITSRTERITTSASSFLFPCVDIVRTPLVPCATSPRYNKLCGSLRSFAHRLSLLPAQDSFRSKMEGQLLSKLYDMGVLNTTAKLSDIENKLTVAAFCRRRLAVVMCMSKMAETVSAVRFVSMSYAP